MGSFCCAAFTCTSLMIAANGGVLTVHSGKFESEATPFAIAR
jgi:hypothetical protein